MVCMNTNVVNTRKAFASPSDQLITLTMGQLQDLMSQAAAQATAPLEERVLQMEEAIKDLDEYTKILGINQDSQRKNLARLTKRKDPGKTALARVGKIIRYLDNRPDHKASYEVLKGHLEINDVLLNQTIAILLREYPGEYCRADDSNDKRKKWLAKMPKIS